MPIGVKARLTAVLRWSEKYTKTDMVYLANGGSWLLLGQVVVVVIGIATTTAFGHFADQDLYGNYKYVLSLASIITAFSLTGIGAAVIQSTAKGYDGALKQGFLQSIRWSWGVVLLSFTVACYYYFIQQNIFLAASLIVVGLLSPLLNAFSLFDAFLTGKKEFARKTIYSSLNALFPALAVIVSLYFTHRAILVIIVYFVANAISDFLIFILARSRERNNKTDPHLLGYGKHLSIMGIINVVADKLDNIIVFSLLGPANLAVYAFVIAIPEQIKNVTKTVAPLAVPRFAERSLAQIDLTIWRRIGLLFLALTVIAVIYMALSPLIFKYLFPLYTEAVGLSQIYVLTVLAAAINTPLASILQAHKGTRQLYMVTNGSSLILLVSLPLLISHFGIVGAIMSEFIYRISYAALAVWQYFVLKRTRSNV